MDFIAIALSWLIGLSVTLSEKLKNRLRNLAQQQQGSEGTDSPIEVHWIIRLDRLPNLLATGQPSTTRIRDDSNLGHHGSRCAKDSLHFLPSVRVAIVIPCSG